MGTGPPRVVIQDQSGEGGVRLATAFQEAAYAVGADGRASDTAADGSTTRYHRAAGTSVAIHTTSSPPA